MEAKKFQALLTKALNAVDNACEFALENDEVSVAEHAELCRISSRLYSLVAEQEMKELV